jgi:hypothetical protein
MFGNQYWVPGLSIAMAIWATLLLLINRLRRICGRWHSLAAAFTAGGILLFGTNEFGLLGELPAVFLVASAFALLAEGSSFNIRSGLGAGLMLGLAIYAKLTVAMTLPAVLLMPWLTTGSGRSGNSDRSWQQRLGWCCAGLALPVVAWQLYQLAALSWSVDAWAGVKSRQLTFLMGTQSLSGIGQMHEAPSVAALLLRNASRNAAAFTGYFGGWWRLLPAVSALALALRVAMRPPVVPAAAKRMSWILLAAVGLHLAWWFLISPTGWYRHLLPAIVYVAILGGVLASHVMDVSRRAAATCVVGCCLTVALVMPSWYPQSGDFPRVWRLNLERDARLSALLQTRDEVIVFQKDESAILVGCGWWVPRDLEYVLPGVNNFNDCFKLNPGDAAGKRLLLVRNEIFNRDSHEPLARYQASCEQRTLYVRDPFVISECPGLPRPDPRS